MIQNYVTLSLETHLFFSRIMKEHALFLAAGFPCKNNDWIQKADEYRQQFERLLEEVVLLSNGRVNSPILNSEELVTEFTISAEERTECLSGIPINTEISELEKQFRPWTGRRINREVFQRVHRINGWAISLLNGLIEFKACILKEVSEGNLFTANYPLLIEHIMREAKLYRETVETLMRNRQVSYRSLLGTEDFWNRIMMEHALFIRGLLDPSEEALIEMADGFTMDYQALLERARRRDLQAMGELTGDSLQETLRYREFKTAGTRGILNCEIASVILPLLADHVLREANHYIRILEAGRMGEGI